jgi:hypothetical protein
MRGLTPWSRGKADILFNGRDGRFIFVMFELVDVDVFASGFAISVEECIEVSEECSDGSGCGGGKGEGGFEI